MNEFGDYLKRLRGNMSLREAAKRTGISFSYIGYLESGKHPRTGALIKPSAEMLKAIAKGYNQPYKELMIKAGYDYEDTDKKESFLDDPQKLEFYELIEELDAEDKAHVKDYVKYWIQKKKQNQ